MLINGSDLMLFVSNDPKDPRSIGCATNHTLELQNQLRSISHKDLGSGYWQFSEFGELSWSCTSENFVCDDTASYGDASSNSNTVRAGKGVSTIYDYFIAKKPVWVEFGLEGVSQNFKDGKVLDIYNKDADGKNGWKPGAETLGGWAWVNSLSINAPCGDYSTYSISLQGHGELKKITHANVQTEAGANSSISKLNLPVGESLIETTETKKSK